MNLRAPQKSEKGFTIIEVMIVLAIAGLIILIVFLAVPALQRNSRNTQRRNDAARVAGLVAEYVSNNDASIPPSASDVGVQTSDLSIYDSLVDETGLTSDVDVLGYVQRSACESGALNSGAGSRSYAIVFAVETSNSTEEQCV